MMIMGMYDDIVGEVSENIEINGYPFYAENITSNESFNRREYNWEPLLNGTEHVTRGRYIHREYNFTTTLYHPTGEPDAHDKILQEIMSKPAKVISNYMGGTFNAIIIFNRSIEEASPNHYTLDVTVTEIPGKTSNIPNENKLVVPNIKKIDLKKTSKKDKKDTTLNNNLKKCNLPFRKNQKTKCVKYLQEKLIKLGYLSSKDKTGTYDKNTVEAVKKVQRSSKGKLKIDGVLGKLTMNYLLKIK